MDSLRHGKDKMDSQSCLPAGRQAEDDIRRRGNDRNGFPIKLRMTK